MKLSVNKVRGSFLNLFEPSSIDGGEPQFNGKFIVDPSDTATITAIEAAIQAVAKEKWGAKAETVLGNMTKTGKKPDLFFVKEAYKNRDGEPYDGFEGKFYISANSKTRPLIIDRDKTPLVPSDGRPYSGCHLNVSLEVWAQDNNFGRAIRAQLKGVQFYSDGDAFSGGTPASPDDFEDLSQGAGAEALA